MNHPHLKMTPAQLLAHISKPHTGLYRVTFRETRRMSEDGRTVKRYFKDETYTVGEVVAATATQRGWAVLTGEAA